MGAKSVLPRVMPTDILPDMYPDILLGIFSDILAHISSVII